MAKSLYIEKISHRILLLGSLIYIINYLFDGVVTGLFALNPSLILNEWEIWRLFSFPFSMNSLEGFLLFVFTFYIIGPKVEQYIGRFIFPFVISLLVILQGIVLTLFFWKDDIAMGGMEGLSFFVLSLYSLLYFGRKSDFSSFRSNKSRMMVSLVAFAWVTVLLVRSYMTGDTDILLTNAVSAMIGFVTGFLLFIQLKMLKKVSRNSRENIPNINIPKPEELSMAMIAQRERRKYQNEQEEQNFQEYDFTFTEDRLNEILDKINEQGKDSLSPYELQYLKEYSRQI